MGDQIPTDFVFKLLYYLDFNEYKKIITARPIKKKKEKPEIINVSKQGDDVIKIF